jgi:hypothetical protein
MVEMSVNTDTLYLRIEEDCPEDVSLYRKKAKETLLIDGNRFIFSSLPMLI